ncbi:unnamed protein product [Eruca vesicaria subsp. sativa]|uniref:Mediator complex subunit 15 KIX domain-containing protein n=1 Tax=Eruca vesicaria subsp. sativa TaxID=29727 RepID=A0ABC8JFC2_ERUVS|nr:unnamed protein product [Eruca vesicaria subsp. sativa]
MWLFGNHLIKDNAEPSLLKEEPAINSGDWRIQLPPNSRQKMVNQLMEILKKYLQYSGQKGVEELRRIAISFEELIFNTALNKSSLIFPLLYSIFADTCESSEMRMDGRMVDYFRKISLKRQTMEEED